MSSSRMISVGLLRMAVSYEKVGNGTMGSRPRGEPCGRGLGYRPLLDGRAADGFRVAAARGERGLQFASDGG